MSKELEIWLEGRPEIIKTMARKYPPGTAFLLHDKIMHVISYREDGGIDVTETDPVVDYDKAVATKVPVCGCCVDKLAESIATYEIFQGTAIKCRRCGCISYNPTDVKERYCGHCHVSHDDIYPPARLPWLKGEC